MEDVARESAAKADSGDAIRTFRFRLWKKTDVVGLCFLGILLCFVILAFLAHQKGVNRLRFYENSTIGCDFTAASEKADGIVRIGDKRVCYFFGRRSTSKKGTLPSQVNTYADLPWFYDAMQFMIDSDNVLVARGWCGETTQIETRKGSLNGSSLDKLNEAP